MVLSTAPDSRERLYTQLSFLIEANDYVAGALMKLIGAEELLKLIHRPDWYPADLDLQVSEELGICPSAGNQINFTTALKRWRRRIAYAPDPQSLLDGIGRVGGGILTPQSDLWPSQLDDLGLGAPLCLWWRSSNPQRLAGQQLGRNVGIVGSRDSSDYGNQVTRELALGLAQRGVCIVSGGAYGVDAAAHHAALQAEVSDLSAAPTIAFLAGGLDRLYPAGNSALLNQVIDRGVLLSEAPPGTTPARFRFLNRNRLIAAFCHLIVVTEARFRSGALNTARQAVELGREVAVIPGSVFSPNSVGTHRLLRAGEAGLITNVQDALELLPGVLGQDAQPQLVPQAARATDGLSSEQALILDVLSRTRCAVVDELCARSGVPAMETLRALHVLQHRGQATAEDSGWKRVGL